VIVGERPKVHQYRTPGFAGLAERREWRLKRDTQTDMSIGGIRSVRGETEERRRRTPDIATRSAANIHPAIVRSKRADVRALRRSCNLVLGLRGRLTSASKRVARKRGEAEVKRTSRA